MLIIKGQDKDHNTKWISPNDVNKIKAIIMLTILWKRENVNLNNTQMNSSTCYGFNQAIVKGMTSAISVITV